MMNELQRLLPHLNRWDEIVELIRNILNYRITGPKGDEPVVLFPWSAGGGYEIGSVIGVVPGSSSTLLGSAVLNSQDWSHGKLSQEFEQSCCSEFADAMASANFLEIQRTKGDAFNIKRIVGIAITATIATTNPDAGKRGGQRAYISIRRDDGIRRVAIRFQHSSEYEGNQEDKRKLQSQIIDLVTLNLVAESLGIPQVPLLDSYRLTLDEGQVVPVEGGFLIDAVKVGVWQQQQLDADSQVLAISAAGEILEEDFLNPLSHTLIPCSANPFTPAHDEMAIHIAKSGRVPVFVINTTNAEKGSVELDEVLRRARAFVGRWPVIILRDMGAFVTMAEKFYCDFAIGADTATRIFLPQYCDAYGGLDNVYARLKATGVSFTVFPRLDARGRLQTRDSVPSMFQDLFGDAPDIISRVSSTAIRQAAQL